VARRPAPLQHPLARADAGDGSLSLERVLITGGGGQLGSDLTEQLSGRAELRSPTREQLDIADDDAVARAIDDFRPGTVVNCAAFHNVDLCETEEEMSFRINGVAVKRMAERCAAAGAKLVHLSTNYVFDGTSPAPYAEDDLPSPRSIYASSKLSGEHAALAYGGGEALVIRGAGLYGLTGSGVKGGNFVTRVLTRAREEGAVTMVRDQRLQPTYTADLASALIEAVEANAAGVLHLTASGECSWLEFTEAIFEIGGVAPKLNAVDTTRRPGSADRPLNGVLARPRADALGLAPLRHWREALEDYMRRAGYAASGG
jgi:dTDP-4-dehydrorhamnose reductase